jgi:arylsulfatase A-like enzyme
MFTGRYPHELSSGWYAPLDNTYPTLAEVLSRHGYATSGFIANTPYCSYETGLDRGFSHFEDYARSTGELLRSSSLIRRTTLQFFGIRRLSGQFDILGRKNAADINRAFLNWLDRSPDRPFFTFLNYFDAHDPYLPPPLQEIPDAWSTDQYRLACSWWFMDKKDLTRAQITEARDAYESCISYLDHQINDLLSELQHRQMLDNTIVLITSDHGELFGEHGLYGHGNCLYRPVLQVPLLILYPKKVPAGLRITQPVSLRDIPSTIIELTGIQEASPLPGTSLVRTWDKSGSREGNAPIFAEIVAPCRVPPDHGRSPVAAGPMRAVFSEGKMYIRNLGNGQEELYDLEDDPNEKINLVQMVENESTIRKMRETLNQNISSGQ